MNLNIPNTDQKRVLIVGAGFGGMSLAKHLTKSDGQVVLVDRHNFHQFPPLFYQVATSGLEPAAIAFPIRKLIKNHPGFFFRMCDVKGGCLFRKIYSNLGRQPKLRLSGTRRWNGH